MPFPIKTWTLLLETLLSTMPCWFRLVTITFVPIDKSSILIEDLPSDKDGEETALIELLRVFLKLFKSFITEELLFFETSFISLIIEVASSLADNKIFLASIFASSISLFALSIFSWLSDSNFSFKIFISLE